MRGSNVTGSGPLVTTFKADKKKAFKNLYSVVLYEFLNVAQFALSEGLFQLNKSRALNVKKL